MNVDWEKRIPELREILKKDDTYSNFEAKLNENLNFLEDLIKTSEQSVILNIKSDDFMQEIKKETIENYLNRILQNDSLSLRFEETTQSYSVVRKNGVIAKNLSEGEKSAIAFAYFLATLQEKDFNLSESIIVIDDPVSSLDQQYLFNIVNLIARCFNKEKSFNQLFVFSHNFYFFKKLRTILNYKNEKDKDPKFNIYEIVKDCNLNSSIINANKYLTNYQSEYLYLIQKLRENLQNCSENELIFAGNSIRKVLEIFLSFRDPKDKGMNARFENVIKTISEDKRYSFDYLQDIVNACSHTDEITDLDDSDDFKLFVNKNMIQQLFDFIELADKEHFKALK